MAWQMMLAVICDAIQFRKRGVEDGVAGMAVSARPYQLCEHQFHEVGPLLQQGREQLAGGCVVGIFARPRMPARRRLGPTAWSSYTRARRAPVARAFTAAPFKVRKDGSIGGRGLRLPHARMPPLHLEFRVLPSSVRRRRLPARTSTAVC